MEHKEGQETSEDAESGSYVPSAYKAGLYPNMYCENDTIQWDCVDVHASVYVVIYFSQSRVACRTYSDLVLM